ncbi:hypothetical protein KXW93_003366, partial [Aspergillus fumigatus]
LNILVVAGKIRTSVVFAARPWITLENYAQYDRMNTSILDALGLGEVMASNISSAFYAFTFLMSVAFAILLDAWLG